jgi:hypothetical protein
MVMGWLRPQAWISLALLAAFSGGARAQALAEYARSERRSAKAGTRAENASRGAGDVWSRLDQMIKSGTGSSRAPSTGTTRRTHVRSRRHTATKSYEDPNQIRSGMGYEEVVRRFGPPYYGVSTGPDTRTLEYLGKDGGLDIELQGDKVTKVAPEKPQQMAAAQK